MQQIFLFIFLIFITYNLQAQKTEISSKLLGIELLQIKNESIINYDFIKETTGKIVIIEFWETWCGPCIEGMLHLQKLKNKFTEKIKIVCVSSDSYNKTTKFIDKNNFPFDFIYDKDKKLSNIFPHTGIPHSVIINSRGQILKETYPGYITENLINKIFNGNSTNVPEKKEFTPEKLNQSFTNQQTKNSLISFELLPYELGDRIYTEKNARPNKRTIITGYSGNTYKDTLEVIKTYKSSGKNILELYVDAFKNYNETRFLFNNNLNYVKSKSPNNRYRLKFEASNIISDFNTLFINQLNTSFGLSTKIIEKEVFYYELERIKIDNKTIKPVSKNQNSSSVDQSFNYLKINGAFVAKKIASIIEEQITHIQNNKYYNDSENKIYFPVITGLKEAYTLNISLENQSSDIDEWISLLKNNGLKLVKKKGIIKYIEINKASR